MHGVVSSPVLSRSVFPGLDLEGAVAGDKRADDGGVAVDQLAHGSGTGGSLGRRLGMATVLECD